MSNDKMTEIAALLAQYDELLSDEVEEYNSMFIKGIIDPLINALRLTLPVVEATIKVTEQMAKETPEGDWTHQWDSGIEESRCVYCGEFGSPQHKETATDPCYARLLDEAIKALTADSQT